MNLPHSLQGSISSFTVTSSSGKQHVYHKLQYVDGKKKINIHIPNDKLSDFEKAVENGKRAKALLAELTEVDAAEIVSYPGETLKKTPQHRFTGHRTIKCHHREGCRVCIREWHRLHKWPRGGGTLLPYGNRSSTDGGAFDFRGVYKAGIRTKKR